MGFKIGNIEIENKIVLAPMAGVSNSAFRTIARKLGAGLVFAEMVSDKGLFFNNEKTKQLLYMEDVEKPMAQQIFGSDIDTMLEAALFIDKNSNCDIIDINMGCPVPKVAIKSQAGAALMKDPNLIFDIVKKIVDNVSKPVTCKIRSGWDHNSINAVEVAKMIEKAGAKAITIHARTRSDGYTGKADLDIIKKVKESVSIPVIGNGDVIDGPSALKMLEYTGCDAVMIGRAALGNPWIFKEIDNFLRNKESNLPSKEEMYKIIIEHLERLIKTKGEKIALLEMRTHGTYYLKGLSNSSKTRKLISQSNTKEELVMILKKYFEGETENES